MIMSICHAHYTGLNWFKLATATKIDADVMYQVPVTAKISLIL